MEQITKFFGPFPRSTATQVFLSTLIPAPHWRAAVVSQLSRSQGSRELDLAPQLRLESSETCFIFNSFQKNRGGKRVVTNLVVSCALYLL